MNDKTKRIKSKLGVNPTSIRETRAAKARGLQRKVEMSSASAKPSRPQAARLRGTPVAMPTKPGNIATGLKKKAVKPSGTPTKKPMTEAQRQAEALDKLMKKRARIAKKTGNWPNYNTN
jgi:predicted P-loop ATPase